MPETETPVVDQPFSDYVRQENAREQADLPVDPAPVVVENPDRASVDITPGAPDTPEPVEPVAAEGDRNTDGTFKPKSDKVTAKGEWKRNQELTAKLRDAERERDALRAAQPSQPPVAPAPAAPLDPSDPEPTIDEFLDKPDPYAALAIAAGKWAVRDERRKVAQVAQAEAAREAQSAIKAQTDEFAQSHPDYYDKLNSVKDIIFPDAVLDAIFQESDLGPAVAYHLASHPDEARRIAALRPVDGVKEIGKIEVRLTPAPLGSEVKTPAVSKARPLIKPVSAAPIAPGSPPPDDLAFGPDYIRQGNLRDRKRAEAMRGI